MSTQSGFNLLTPISKVRKIGFILPGEDTGHNDIHACYEKYKHDREGLNSSSEEILVRMLDKTENAGVDDSDENLKRVKTIKR